jgi:acyl-CoA synthetase (AMP-forming)/AMP-acid ligase II
VTPLAGSTWRELFARRIDERPAVQLGRGAYWTGAELVERAAGASAWLDSLGAVAGAPMPALLTATPEALALTVAGALWDRPVAPLGPRLAPDDVAHCVRGLAARVLITEPDRLELARNVGALTGATVHVLPEELPRVEASVSADTEPDAIAGYLHTSGTTGYPKAVPMREGRLVCRVRQNATALGVGTGCVYSTAAGYHHIAGLGMILVVLGAGGSIAPLRSFSVDAWRALAERAPTHALLVPTQIEMLLESDALDLGRLEVLQYGASPIHPETLQAALRALPRTRFVQIYGQTEGSPITILDHEDHLRALEGETDLLSSNGRAVQGLDLELADVDEAGLGEVRARAAHLFVSGTDGWLATGDLGRIDERGYLFLAGRLGDKIIRGGENVYPLEVERALEAHPAVAEAAVVGVADRRLGERIAAVVVPATDAGPLSDTELVVWCRDRLAHFKVPEQWSFVDALPRNAAGKLLRRNIDLASPTYLYGT